MRVGRGSRPGQRTVTRHFNRSLGIRLALLAGVAEVRGTVSPEPLVLPSGVGAMVRLTRERLSQDSERRVLDTRSPEAIVQEAVTLGTLQFCESTNSFFFFFSKMSSCWVFSGTKRTDCCSF